MRPVIQTLLPAAAGCLALVMTGCKPAGQDAPAGGAWVIAPTGPTHIYVPATPTPEELEAADDLAHVISEASGRPAYVAREPGFFRRDGIYIGGTKAAKELLNGCVAAPQSRENDYASLPSGDWDCVAWISKDGRIAIAGATPLATRFAVARFAEKECGARWWLPGALGEDIPKASSIPLAQGTTLEKPSYVSRFIGTRKTPDELQWQRRSGLAEHVQSHHSLHALLNKTVARDHPDWFPTFNGKPYHPDRQKGPGPHPNFLSDEAAAYVAQKADAFFDANPGNPCFSISPADNTLFGDLDAYKGLIPTGAAFRGKANLSNAVFAFDNKVAARVAEKHPDRFLGALAYAFYEAVPDAAVAPNLVPFLTADRSQWYDPAFRAEDLALAARWAKAGPKLVATWDYYYGYPFLVPRVMLDAVKDSIPSLREAGVGAFYAEMNPIWGFDAPKAWIAAQLLWDSRQNPDALEAEFFKGCYGPAADDMRQFFEKCDAAWNAQPGKARWIRYYGDIDQAAIYSSADLAELRGHLEDALTRPLSEKTRRRIQLTAEAFGLTTRVAQAQTAFRRVAQWSPGMSPQTLVTAIPPYLAARRDMRQLFVGVTPLNNPVLPLNPLAENATAPEAPGYLTDDDPLAGRIAFAAPLFDAQTRAHLAIALPTRYETLLRGANPLLRSPFADGLKNWLVTHWPNPLLRYSMEGTGPDAALRVSKANTFCLMLKARVKPSTIYGMAFGADGRVSASSQVQLTLEYLDKAGATLAVTADSLPYGELHNAPLAVAALAPEGTDIARLTVAVKYQAEEDTLRLHAWRTPQP